MTISIMRSIRVNPAIRGLRGKCVTVGCTSSGAKKDGQATLQYERSSA